MSAAPHRPDANEIREHKAKVRSLIEDFQRGRQGSFVSLAIALFGLALDLVVELVAQLAEANERESQGRQQSQQMFINLEQMMKMVSGREELWAPVDVVFQGHAIKMLAPPVAALLTLLQGLLQAHGYSPSAQDLENWQVQDSAGHALDPYSTLAELPADVGALVFNLKPGVAA